MQNKYYRIYIGFDPCLDFEDGMIQFSGSLREGNPENLGSNPRMATPAILNPDLDESAFPYTDCKGGWVTDTAVTYNPNAAEWFSARPWAEYPGVSENGRYCLCHSEVIPATQQA